jgi:serine/threonine protein kinase
MNGPLPILPNDEPQSSLQVIRFPLLKVIAGPDQGKTLPLPRSGSVVVGRGVGADLSLMDGRASRRHFQVTAQHGRVRVRDLGSKAGTIVNNVLLDGEQAVHTGDILIVGETYLQLISDEPPEPPDITDLPIPSPEPTPAQVKARTPAKSSKGAPSLPAQTGMPAGVTETLRQRTNTMMAHYALGPVLAIGKTGAVFRARDNREQRDVALKIFMPEFSRDPADRQRFVRAATTARDLRQLNLVSVYNAGCTDGTCWLAMELIEGPSLAWVVQQATMRTVPDYGMAQRILRDVTRALIYLHGKSILHRNLTPENLLVSNTDSLVKVSDLITVKAQEGKLAQNITQEGEIIGDLRYLAPERTDGGPDAGDARSDLYGLGAIVYAVLTGKPPIEGDNPVDTIEKIRRTPPVPLRQLLPSIPAALNTVVMRLLAKDPEQRFPDATALLRDLAQNQLIG